MSREQTIRTIRQFGIVSICALMLGGAISRAQAQTERSFHFKLVNARLIEGSNPLRLQHGDHVNLIWTSDKPVEVHLHGYDLLLKLLPGQPGSMSLNCRATGRFPVTLHKADGSHSHKPLLYIEVHPK